MLKKYLMAPGPTPVPESVLLAMARPMIHHRTSEFEALFAEVRVGLSNLFRTRQDVLILAGSGTAAMEAAIVNTLSEGDTVIVVNAGKFGQRWSQICETFGISVVSIDVEWGRSVMPEQVEQRLIEHPNAKAVLVQASETSTTASHPIEELAKLTALREDTLLIVDGITAVGVSEIPMDDWGIDVLVTGSQKALMLPPGLGLIAMSDKAWKMAERSTINKYYLNLTRERKSQQNNTTAYTPAVSLIIGLREVLSIMNEETLDGVFARHAANAEATRAAGTALGFELLAKDLPSGAATGIWLPEGFDGGKFVKYMRETVGITYAGGQDHLKGRVIRLSHLGYHDAFDTITGLAGIEMGLKKFGVPITLGAGIAAAEAVLTNRLG